MVFEMFGDHENIGNNGNFQISLPRAEAVLEYFKTTKKPSPEKRGRNGSLKGLLGITVQKIGYLTHPSQCFGEKR